MIRVEHGDSREVLKGIADGSVASIVTDPPYSLVSIQKRFGKPGSAAAKGDVYRRSSAGFMSKTWDTGETAFDPEFWAECLRVLKPGGHVLAFGGTRTYHRLVCAIEDAGFDIRNTISWMFGSGFPKSHNVSKGIDKANGHARPVLSEGEPVKRMIPGADQNKAGWEKNNGREFTPTVTAAASAAWEGWGTALKPAMELICVGRKPLIGTVVANVLAHGTGALNIDGCRVEVADAAYAKNASGDRGHADNRKRDMDFAMTAGSASEIGRWPANVVHDGSAEVVEAFPQSNSTRANGNPNNPKRGANHTATSYGQGDDTPTHDFRDAGSAARFFYSSKADADDRLGSKHPTVKPVDLMRWLVRLVTPPGGLVLDPFAGSGTTGMACMAEGFDALLIEREAEYVADIRRRIAHVSGQDAPLFARGL